MLDISCRGVLFVLGDHAREQLVCWTFLLEETLTTKQQDSTTNGLASSTFAKLYVTEYGSLVDLIPYHGTIPYPYTPCILIWNIHIMHTLTPKLMDCLGYHFPRTPSTFLFTKYRGPCKCLEPPNSSTLLVARQKRPANRDPTTRVTGDRERMEAEDGTTEWPKQDGWIRLKGWANMFTCDFTGVVCVIHSFFSKLYLVLCL